MDERIALLLIFFLFGCTSTVGGANTNPTLSSTLTSTLTPLPSFTPTTTLTSTPTFTPTPAPISAENAKALVLLKKISETSDTGLFNYNRIAFSPDFKTYTTTSNNKTLILWNAVTGQKINTISIDDPIYAVVFSPDGKTIAITSSTGIVGSFAKMSFWDSVTGEQISTVNHCTAGVFSSNGKTIFNGGELCDVMTGQILQRFDFNCLGICYIFAISPDGKVVAVTNDIGRTQKGKHEIILWDTATGKQIMNLDANIYPPGIDYFPTSAIAFSPDGKLIASIDERNLTIIWDIATGEKVSVFDPISRKAGLRSDEMWGGQSIAFSPNGKMLVTGHVFGSIIFWDVATGNPIHVIKADVPSWILHPMDRSKAIDSLVFSADGKMLAAVERDNVATIYGLSSDTSVVTLSPASNPSTSLANLDVSGSIAALNAPAFKYKSDTYKFLANKGTYTVELNTDDNSNICFLNWQITPITDATSIAAAGDSNRPDLFTIDKLDKPTEYVISIGRARVTDQCQAFSYTLKITQQP